MAKIKYDDIRGLGESWQNFAGSSVEKFIKKELSNRVGYIYRSRTKEGDFYYLYGFIDYEQYEKWADGDSTIKPLFKVQLPNIENDTFTVNLSTNSDTTKLVNLGEGVIVELKYTSVSTNPTTGISVDTYNDGTLIIQRSANGSSYSEVARVPIQPIPDAEDRYFQFNLTPYLLDGDNKIRMRVEDSVNGGISANLTFQSIVNTTLKVENATSTATPISALQFQYYIQGQIAKTLHIKITQNGVFQQFNYPIGNYTFIEVPYITPTMEMAGLVNGIIEVDTWLSVDDTAVVSNHNVSQFYYTDGSAASTVIILNNVSTAITNYANMHLFDMALYNQGADVNVKILSIDGNTEYLSVDYNNCQTGTIYPIYATPEIESQADSISAMVVVSSANFNCTPYLITIDNTEKMSPVAGADFILNPKVRNNSEAHPDTIINSANGNTVSSTFTGFGFIDDGWVSDNDNIGVLRIPAEHSLTINYDVLDSLQNGTSIELDFKVRNIFDDSDEVIKMYTKNSEQNYLGFVMNATEAGFYTAENQTKRDQDVVFQEEARTHMVVNIVPNLSNSGLNYIRIFVNGILNREMLYTNNDVFKSGAVSMVLGSQNCDLDIYGIRVYKSGLSASDIRQNYMSSLPNSEDKVAFKAANDIISANGTISYDKAKEKYNTLVWTGAVPSAIAVGEYAGKLDINIIGDAEHSGQITNLRIKGQGSSSKKYWKWNHQYDFDKLEEPTVWTDGNGEVQSGGYKLTANDPAAKKLVAKLNWASSMQSHKLGSTAMYTDLWREIVGGNGITKTAGYEDVRVSVHEKPFLYFVRQTDYEQPVFYGLMTFGSGKYDKPTFGYDKNVFPDYLILEGSDNGLPLTLRQVPWFDDEVSYSDEDEAYVYAGQPSIDYGMGKQANVGYFKNAFNFAYLHSPFLIAFTGSIPESANKKNQYWDTATKNVYRYDYIGEEWVNAGITKTNGEYDVLNLETQSGLLRSSYDSDAAYTNAVIAWRISDFKAKVDIYYNPTDVLFSMAFLKLIGASDNWCKNTYEYLDPISHKICLAQDDMDTLMLTDNVGRKNKPYYVEEHDTYNNNGSVGYYFNGEDNVFFNLMEMAFGAEERAMMKQILNTMRTMYESPMGAIQHYFFNVQEYFPAVAYNETARLLYEEASVKQSQGIYSNPTPAISQSLGDQLQAEKQWWKRRIPYMQSWSSTEPFYVRSTIEPSLEFRSMLTVGGNNPSYVFTLKPWQYLYPKVGVGQAMSSDNTRVQGGQTYSTDRMLTDGNTDTFIYGSDYYTSFGEFGGISLSETFNLNGKRLLEFSADSREVQEYNFRPSRMNISCPQLRSLCLYGCSTLAGSLDLSGSGKLESVDLRGTGINSVILPESITLTEVYLPNLTSIYVNNLPNLLTLNIQSFTNLVNLNTDREDLALNAMVNATNLSSLTLRGMNLSTNSSNAEAVLDVLINPNIICDITGHIYIAKALSMDEVSALETKFGNSVFDTSSAFYITYILIPPTQIILDTDRKSIFQNDTITINSTFNGNEAPKSWDWTITGSNNYTLVKSINSVVISTNTLSTLENVSITYALTRQDDTVLTQTVNISACPYDFKVKYTNPSGVVVEQSIFNHTFDALFMDYYAIIGPVQFVCSDNTVNYSVVGTDLGTTDDGVYQYFEYDDYHVISYGDFDGDGVASWSNQEGFENWSPESEEDDSHSPMIYDNIIFSIDNISIYVPLVVQTRLYKVNVAPISPVQCVNGYGTLHVSFNNPDSYNNIIQTYDGKSTYIIGDNSVFISNATNITRFGCDFQYQSINHSQEVSVSICINQINPYGGDSSAVGGLHQYLPGPKTYIKVNLIYVEQTTYVKAKYNITTTGTNQVISNVSSVDISKIAQMTVDNVSITPSKTVSFDTTGEHIIEYVVDSTYNNLLYLMKGVSTIIEAEIRNTSTLGNEVFYNCPNLEKVVIDGNITSIGDMFLNYCRKVNTIIINSSVAPTIVAGTFGTDTSTAGYNSDTTNVLYVPSGATGYDTSNWTDNLLNAQYGKFTLSDTL